MRRVSKVKINQSGSTLIDLMIGIVISLLATIIVIKLFVAFGASRAFSVDGSEAQIDAINMVAMLEKDIRLSGYGIIPKSAYGCVVKRHYIKPIADLNLMPVVIEDGENGSADSIKIIASSKKNINTSYALINPHPANSDVLILNSNLGMVNNDLLVLSESGKNCTMLQVTNVDDDHYRVRHEGVRSPWNPDLPATIFPVSGYAIGTGVMNLGELIEKKYFVNNNFELQVENHFSKDNSKKTNTIVAGVINFQIQYGFDTKKNNISPAEVTHWSAVMIDADGNGSAGDNNDIRRIIAIRFAIVKKSLVNKISNSGECELTVTPVWWAGNATTGQLEEVTIDVSKNSDGTPINDWKCYRYFVYESVIPLRNMLWGNA